MTGIPMYFQMASQHCYKILLRRINATNNCRYFQKCCRIESGKRLNKPLLVSSIQQTVSPTPEKMLCALVCRHFTNTSDSSLQGLGEHLTDISDIDIPALRSDVSVDAEDLYKAISRMDPAQVLDMYSTIPRKLDKFHHALSIKRLSRLAVHMDPVERERFKQQLNMDQRFQVLTALLSQKGRYYEAHVVYDMVRFLPNLGIPTNHPAMKIFLQLSKHHINNLDLSKLIRMAFTLSNLKVTGQIEALLKGIAIIVENLTHEYEFLTTWEKIKLLDTCGQFFNEDTRVKILQLLANETDEIGWKYSVILLRAIKNMKQNHNKLYTNIENHCLIKVIKNFDKLDSSDILSALESCTALHIYSPDFLNLVANCDSFEISELLSVLRHFRQQVYKDSDFMKNVINGIKSEVLHGISAESAIDIIGAMSDFGAESSESEFMTEGGSDTLTYGIHNGDHGGANCDDIIEELTYRITDDINSITPEKLIDVSIAMTVLYKMVDCLILEKLKAMPTAFDVKSDTLKLTNDEKLCLITGSGVQTSEIIEVKNSQFKNTMTSLFKYSHVIKHSCVLPCGLYVDHLLTTDDERPTAVRVFGSSMYTTNTCEMLGSTRLYKRTLENMGYHVVLINRNTLNAVPEEERYDYLKKLVSQHMT